MSAKLTMSCVCAAAIASVLCVRAANTEENSKPRIYSNLCTEKYSGDIAGYEVTLSVVGRIPSVLFDWTEGALMKPVHASNVAFDRETGELSFSAVATDRPLVFQGRVDTRTLTGMLHWGPTPHGRPSDEPLQLARQYGTGNRSKCAPFRS